MTWFDSQCFIAEVGLAEMPADGVTCALLTKQRGLLWGVKMNITYSGLIGVQLWPNSSSCQGVPLTGEYVSGRCQPINGLYVVPIIVDH